MQIRKNRITGIKMSHGFIAKENLMGKLILMMLLTIASAGVEAANGDCAKDEAGRTFCPPTISGSAVRTPDGVLCAPGLCTTDNSGDLKCSGQTGGGISKDETGKVFCLGGCISPTKEYCSRPTSEWY